MSEELIGIYKITNTLDGKTYVGSSVDIRCRRNEHFRELRLNIHRNARLQNSYNKYGKQHFTHEVLEILKEREELQAREQYYIDTLNPFYNICRLAYRGSGTKRSDEVKKRMSIALKAYCAKHGGMTKGRKLTPAQAERLRLVHVGKVVSQSTRDKMSKIMTGRKATDEARKNMSIAHLGNVPANKGVPCSDEKKKKISDSRMGILPWNKGMPCRDSTKEKLRIANTGRPKTQSELDKKRKPVHQIDPGTNLIIKTWSSSKEAGESLGINIGNIATCCTGKRKSKKTGGFIWQTA